MQKDDITQLDAIIGTWKSDGETIAQNGEKPVKIKGTDAYEWLPGGKEYMIHRIDVFMGDQEVHAIELIGNYDEAAGAYSMHAFQTGGGHSLMHASKNDDGTWLFAGDEMRATLTPSKDGGRTMSAKWERREGQNWIHWMNMRFSK